MCWTDGSTLWLILFPLSHALVVKIRAALLVTLFLCSGTLIWLLGSSSGDRIYSLFCVITIPYYLCTGVGGMTNFIYHAAYITM